MRMCWRSNYLRSGGASTKFNCGYGKGFSVRDVIDTVKRVSGVDFKVNVLGRRPGDAAAIVAKADRIRDELGWSPKYDDLEKIVQQALRWERHLNRNACVRGDGSARAIAPGGAGAADRSRHWACEARADFRAFVQRLSGRTRRPPAYRAPRSTLPSPGMTPDASVVAQTKKQSEFVRPIWDYVDGAVTGNRVARGRAHGRTSGAIPLLR
jgi:hypothetical protein